MRRRSMQLEGGADGAGFVRALLLHGFLALLISARTVTGFANGVLQAACGNMVPQHGTNEPSYNATPFQIYVENLNSNGAYLVNERLAVTINSTNYTALFNGFMLQVKTLNNLGGQPVATGFWEAADYNSKTLNCFSRRASSLVQTGNKVLYSMTAFWTPTDYVSDTLVVVGTVTQSYSLYYTGIQSNTLVSPNRCAGGVHASSYLAVTPPLRNAAALLLFHWLLMDWRRLH